MLTNKIYHGDCFEVMKGFDDDSIDTVITDPPYGIGLDTWDKPIDIGAFTQEVDRLLKPDGFYVFFGQMPTMVEWILESRKRFNYREHISWVKRNGLMSCRLTRTHEDILIWSKNRAKFYKTKGKYTDVKVEGLYNDVVTIQTIKRYIDDLVNGRSYIQHRSNKSNAIYNRMRSFPVFSRSPEFVNFTNVWSFVPANRLKHNHDQQGHPTQKPVRVMERLVEMLTLKDMLILDPFCGSGTTGVACAMLGRDYVMIEQSEQYCEMARKRIDDATRQKTLF